MKIGPTQSSGNFGRPVAGNKSPAETESPVPQGNRETVTISSAGRRRLEAEAASLDRGEIGLPTTSGRTARIRAIRMKIEDGFYDRLSVSQQIAGKLADRIINGLQRPEKDK